MYLSELCVVSNKLGFFLVLFFPMTLLCYEHLNHARIDTSE